MLPWTGSSWASLDGFYRAFLAADDRALAELVAPEAAWVVRLETALSGAHVGPSGIAALRRQIDHLTAGSWRPLRADSYDIATSPCHAVIMDRFLAERGAFRLDSHEAVIVAVDEERIMRLFHYLHDPGCFRSLLVTLTGAGRALRWPYTDPGEGLRRPTSKRGHGLK